MMKLVLRTTSPPTYISANGEIMRDGERRSPHPGRQDRGAGWRLGAGLYVK